MKGLVSKLTSAICIWSTLALTLVLTAVFGLVMHIWNFTIIDEMANPQMIRVHIEAMSHEQRRAHAWLTATVDVVYPFAYSALFAGLALRFLGRAGKVLAWMAAIAVPADLIEGFAQVVALNGGFFILPLKAIVTPIKLFCWAVPGLGAVIAAVVATKRRFFSAV